MHIDHMNARRSNRHALESGCANSKQIERIDPSPRLNKRSPCCDVIPRTSNSLTGNCLRHNLTQWTDLLDKVGIQHAVAIVRQTLARLNPA